MYREHVSMIGAIALARDGNAGRVVDFLFHDDDWKIHYAVIRTGDRLRERKLLVARDALVRYDRGTMVLQLSKSTKEVMRCPDLDSDPPVWRQREAVGRQNGPVSAARGAGDLLSMMMARSPEVWDAQWEERIRRFDPFLRSASEIGRYKLMGGNRVIGVIEGCIINEYDWTISHISAQVEGPAFLERRMIDPRRILRISWEDRIVVTDIRNPARELGDSGIRLPGMAGPA
jgi:hypothetical protein